MDQLLVKDTSLEGLLNSQMLLPYESLQEAQWTFCDRCFRPVLPKRTNITTKSYLNSALQQVGHGCKKRCRYPAIQRPGRSLYGFKASSVSEVDGARPGSPTKRKERGVRLLAWNGPKTGNDSSTGSVKQKEVTMS
jgi:RNase P subunit RPR2